MHFWRHQSVSSGCCGCLRLTPQCVHGQPQRQEVAHAWCSITLPRLTPCIGDIPDYTSSKVGHHRFHVDCFSDSSSSGENTCVAAASWSYISSSAIDGGTCIMISYVPCHASASAAQSYVCCLWIHACLMKLCHRMCVYLFVECHVAWCHVMSRNGMERNGITVYKTIFACVCVHAWTSIYLHVYLHGPWPSVS